ncbi:hypothetical protein ACS0TY_031697 [Phlomoides rotata]
MGRRKSKFRYRPKMGKEIPATIASSSAPPPPWIELPEDITANILKRLGAVEILKSAQTVCTTWRRVSHDPSMWRVIDLENPERLMEQYDLICRQAVDRSQGQLVDLSVTYFGDDELINYVAYRSSHLKRPTLHSSYFVDGKSLAEAIKKVPHLDELHLNFSYLVFASDIETIGKAYPMLKSFSYNKRGPEHPYLDVPYFFVRPSSNDCALAIAKSMPNLRHLRLFAQSLNNEGLEAILDGCPHLESLDLRKCLYLRLCGAVAKRCFQQIKDVKCDIEWLKSDSDYEFYDCGDYFDD